MSTYHVPKMASCPLCGGLVSATEWSREPRETTWEQPGVPMWRTYEPGPFADVKLSCGEELHGTEGVAFLAALAAA